MSVTKPDQKTKKLAKKLSERYLKNSGEYYLNRYPASSAHFLSVMTRKIDRSCHDHPDQNRQDWIDHIQTTLIPYFEKLGFLNDTLYAQAVYNSLSQKGLSKTALISKMRLKKIDGALIDSVIDDDFSDKNAADIFARKRRIGKYRPTPYQDYKEKERDLGKLARAGFSYDIAKDIIDSKHE